MDLERVPAALRDRLGTDASVGLLSVFDETRSEWAEEVMDTSAYRFERRLAEETSRLRIEMAQGFASMREEMTRGLAALRSEITKGDADLRAAIADQRFEILKWTFVFWTGQFFVSASFLVMLVRALR